MADDFLIIHAVVHATRMTARQVLLMTYDFPPGLSGVRRIVKFAKFLPEFGFQPVVLAAQPNHQMPLDWAALKEVEAQGYPVHRTASLDPYQAPALIKEMLFPRRDPGKLADSSGLVIGKGMPVGLRRVGARVARFLFVPDDRIGWVPFAIGAAARLIRKHNISVVMTSSYPHSAHLAGLFVARRFGVPWVADFRDGWTQNPYFGNGPTRLHTRLNSWLERCAASRADALIAVSEPIAEHFARLSGRGKVHLIPNGYDRDDFADLPRIAFDRFTLAYTGTLFMQRSPESFLTAVRMLLDERPELESRFQIVLMTKFQPEHQEQIRRLRLGGVVQNRGLGPYREALALQASADALLVMEGETANSGIMMTQKVFEYLAAAKPILAMAPSGALSTLVRRSRTGIVVAPADVAGIKRSLFELVSGKYRYEPDHNYVENFDRRTQAGQLARVLECVIAQH